MSFTITLSSTESILVANFFPPIYLNQNYECGLIDFETYNSIPNVDETNNLFHIDNKVISLPTGSYEIDDIAKFIEEALKAFESNIIDKFTVDLKPNNNTLQSEIKSTHLIKFNESNSIGSLLGFSKRILEPDIKHTSDLPININKVTTVRIECNIIDGAYFNDKPVHVIHEFSPSVAPGYKISEVPNTVIFLPVNVQAITQIYIKLIDQDNNLINFRGENILIRLFFKPQNAGF